jgi:hypothetical protein
MVQYSMMLVLIKCFYNMGNQSVEQMFCTREIFDDVPPSIQASMGGNAPKYLTVCLHYSDDWELMGDDN